MCKEHLILAFLGIFIHMGWSILNRRNKDVPFSIIYVISNGKNYIRLSLAISSTIAILLMSDDVAHLLNITLSDGTPLKKVLAFFAGYFNHSLIKRIVTVFNKKLNK